MLSGCSVSLPNPFKTPPRPPLTPEVKAPPAVTLRDTVPKEPLFVPPGVDSAAVVEVDSLFGDLIDEDSLAVLKEEDETLQLAVEEVDTLSSVLRFLQSLDDSAEETVFSRRDSLVIGEFLLRAEATRNPQAAALLKLDRAVNLLLDFVERSGVLASDVRIKANDWRSRRGLDEIRMALFGFTDEASEFQRELMDLRRTILQQSTIQDSLNFQLAMEKYVRDFYAMVDKAIRTVKESAANLRHGTRFVSPEVRRLEARLAKQRDALVEFQSHWQQLHASGNLARAVPEYYFDPERIEAILENMRRTMELGRRQAARIATTLDTVTTSYEVEIEAREDAHTFADEFSTNLGKHLKDLRAFAHGYIEASRRRGARRIQGANVRQGTRKDLHTLVAQFLEIHEDLNAIRSSQVLVQNFLLLSDRLLLAEDRHIQAVREQADLRNKALIRKAEHLASRAQILGDKSEYKRAREIYSKLIQEYPNRFYLPFKMGELYFREAQEEDRRPAEVADLLKRAGSLFHRCEGLTLAERREEKEWDQVDQAFDQIAPGDDETADENESTTPATELIVSTEGYYFERFIEPAWQNLTATLGPLMNDRRTRRRIWRLDAYRRELAWLQGDGEEYMFRYARQLHLSDDDAQKTEILSAMKLNSWDNANLVLAERWSRVIDKVNDPEADQSATRDSLLALYGAVRTEGVRREAEYVWAVLDFRLGHHDESLDRLFALDRRVLQFPNPNPEVGSIDSTITAEYPRYLYERALLYLGDGERKYALALFRSVAERDTPAKARAFLQAAKILRQTHPRDAIDMARSATKVWAYPEEIWRTLLTIGYHFAWERRREHDRVHCTA